MKDYNKKEFGDYQTPPFFCETVCDYLKGNLNVKPDIIIEPTCGIGNFLKSASQAFPNARLYGIDIDDAKLENVDKDIPNLELINEDIFNFSFDRFNKTHSFLIIGNPPWATNTELSKMESTNLPVKSNFKKLREIDAMTGESNFDISESIIRKIIYEFKDTNTTIAFLCKTVVSRNVFMELVQNGISYSLIRQLNFDSGKIFKIDADACLLILQFGGKALNNMTCEVSDISAPSKTLYKFGFKSGRFYSNMDDIPDIDGDCIFEWRQGVKHDCAQVMELTCNEGQLTNKNDETLCIENTLIYPLLKSSQLKKPVIRDTSKYIIITQRKIKQDTSYIKSEAPETWKYLTDHEEYFNRRKSSIYMNAHRFSIFGIGEYSFKKYKVAVSGFYKNPIFCLAYHEKPFMLDDTCYFLSFDDYDEAYITMLILNNALVIRFLKNIAFLDSKRPYTKKVLKRVDIGRCLNVLSFEDLKKTENDLKLEDYLSNEKLINYNKLHNI